MGGAIAPPPPPPPLATLLLVSDYDLEQYVKTLFLKTSCFYFLEHTEDFLRSQSVAQPGEGSKGAMEA